MSFIFPFAPSSWFSFSKFPSMAQRKGKCRHRHAHTCTPPAFVGVWL